jgi:phage/plasmid-like protein (TIGR03299 family)
VLNDTADESIRINRQEEQMSVQIQNAARRKAPWISTATWVNSSDEQISATQVLENANLDWEVQHTPLSTTAINNDGVTVVTLEDKVATTRVNKDGSASVLGITSPTYTIVQNNDIVNIVDSVMYEAGAIYQSAGELRGGKKIFMAAKLPDTLDLTLKNVDPVEAFLVASNTHDGTDSLRFEIKYLRLICKNGMTRWTNASSISFRHSARMNVKIEDVRETLGVVLKSNEEFNLLSSALFDKKVANSDFWSIVKDVLPLDENNMTERQQNNVRERQQTLLGIWNGPTQENIKGTAWGIVNAFTEYEQWTRTTRSANDFAAGERFMMNQGTSLSDRVLEMVR